MHHKQLLLAATMQVVLARRHTYVVQCDGNSNDDPSGWGRKGCSKGGNTLGLHTEQHSTSECSTTQLCQCDRMNMLQTWSCNILSQPD